MHVNAALMADTDDPASGAPATSAGGSSAESDARSLHEELVDDVRVQSSMQMASALVLLLPATLLAWIAWALPEPHPALSAALALIVTLGLASQSALAMMQLRTSDPDRMATRLALQPPVFIPVQLGKPPILQALDVLSSLRSHHHLTDGNPCAPRLVIQPVDAACRPVDPNADLATPNSRHLSTSRALVREPLQFSQAKIRQSVKDPRSLRWEENAALLGSAAEGDRRASAGAASSASDELAGGGGGGLHLNGDVMKGDVHDFITANYGSALRNAEEAAEHAGHGGPTGLRVSLRSIGLSVLAASGGAAERHGLALPLELPLVDDVKAMLHKAVSRGTDAWEFDAFALREKTNDHALLFLGYHVFRHEGIQVRVSQAPLWLKTALKTAGCPHASSHPHHPTQLLPVPPSHMPPCILF